MTDQNIGDLLPIAKAQVGAGLIETTSARGLHAYLEVGKDFSNWIKGRIDAYQFVEGQDYVVEEGLSSPISASSNARHQRTVEYHLTLDMAKELAMVERNAKGKEARRYFIRCEQLARDGVHGLTAKQMGGIAKAVLKKGLAELKAEIVQIVREEVAAHAAPGGHLHTSVEFVPALTVIDDAGVPAKGRGGLVRKASNSLARFCYRNGHLVRAEAHTDRRLFHVDAVVLWLKEDGMPMIRRHLDRLAGQSVMQFPKSRRIRPVPPAMGEGEGV